MTDILQADWWSEVLERIKECPAASLAAEKGVSLGELDQALIKSSTNGRVQEECWWPELLRCLETDSIHALARRFGTNARRVRRGLARCSIRVAGVSVTETGVEALLPFQERLGKEPDTVIAKASGLTPEAIQGERRRLGIPAFRMVSNAEAWGTELLLPRRKSREKRRWPSSSEPEIIVRKVVPTTVGASTPPPEPEPRPAPAPPPPAPVAPPPPPPPPSYHHRPFTPQFNPDGTRKRGIYDDDDPADLTPIRSPRNQTGRRRLVRPMPAAAPVVAAPEPAPIRPRIPRKTTPEVKVISFDKPERAEPPSPPRVELVEPLEPAPTAPPVQVAPIEALPAPAAPSQPFFFHFPSTEKAPPLAAPVVETSPVVPVELPEPRIELASIFKIAPPVEPVLQEPLVPEPTVPEPLVPEPTLPELHVAEILDDTLLMDLPPSADEILTLDPLPEPELPPLFDLPPDADIAPEHIDIELSEPIELEAIEPEAIELEPVDIEAIELPPVEVTPIELAPIEPAAVVPAPEPVTTAPLAIVIETPVETPALVPTMQTAVDSVPELFAWRIDFDEGRPMLVVAPDLLHAVRLALAHLGRPTLGARSVRLMCPAFSSYAVGNPPPVPVYGYQRPVA